MGEVAISLSKTFGINTTQLERSLALLREIQSGVQGAERDVIQSITNNQLFNPTNNVTVENKIELKQDPQGRVSVVAVTSNANRSTVKLFDTGTMTPVFT